MPLPISFFDGYTTFGLSGALGASIYCYAYARESGNTSYEAVADKLLDEVIDHLLDVTGAGFMSGNTGIGWGIAYLLQHGFIEGDADEMLGNLDELLFEARLQRATLYHGDTDRWGYGLYFLIRAQTGNLEGSAGTIKKSVLAYFVDECERMLLPAMRNHKSPEINFTFLNSILYFLLETSALGVRRQKIITILEALLSYYATSQIVSSIDWHTARQLIILASEQVAFSPDSMTTVDTIMNRAFRSDINSSQIESILDWDALIYSINNSDQ